VFLPNRPFPINILVLRIGYPASGAGLRGETLSAIDRDNAGNWVQMVVGDKTLWASTEVISLDADDIMRPPVD
jgi:hypothetical protein